MSKIIEIEVDCNSDIITLFENNREVATIEVKHPNKFISFFSEIFNRLNNEDGKINNISLTKIDEDRKKTMEEW